MKYCHTNDEIDEIGEGLVRQFNFDSYSKGQAVDIEKFITDYLKYQIVYDNMHRLQVASFWLQPFRLFCSRKNSERNDI